MPMGKGTYGSKKGRPPAKKGMSKGMSKLPAAVRKKILKKKCVKFATPNRFCSWLRDQPLGDPVKCDTLDAVAVSFE